MKLATWLLFRVVGWATIAAGVAGSMILFAAPPSLDGLDSDAIGTVLYALNARSNAAIVCGALIVAGAVFSTRRSGDPTEAPPVAELIVLLLGVVISAGLGLAAARALNPAF